jgi:outer membrane protein assembly factor BamB
MTTMSARPDPFDQFTGPFDRPIAPSPAFTERLRHAVHQRAGSASSTVDDVIMPRLATAAPARSLPPRQIHPESQRSRWSGRIAAAILVLVLASLAISLARLQAPSETAPRETTVGDGGGQTITTLPLADGNWGGGTGHTWAYTLPESALGDVSITQGGETSSFTSAQSIVSNGSLIVSSRPQPDGSFVLGAFTLTGNPRWQVPIGAMPGMAIDNDRLYIIQTSYTATDNPRPLTAISLATGEVLWTGPELASTGKPTFGWSPIVANGVVYVANLKGGAYALDAVTGKLLWEAPIADDAVPNRADGSSVTQEGGSIALGKDGLFVAGWTNTIRNLDPATGKVLATITLDPGMTNLDLALRDSTLIAKANVMVSDGVIQGTLVAIDTGTNAIRWTQSTPTRIDDNLVLLADRVIVSRVDRGENPTLSVDGYRLTDGELLSIPMPMIETSGASLSAIDGPKPLLLIVSDDYALTVVDVETGMGVARVPAATHTNGFKLRPVPVIRVGDVLIFAQPNGNWFRITP